MSKWLKNEDGFTLIEFMVALFITSVIAGTIASLLAFHFKTFESAQEMNNVQYEAQVTLNDLTRVMIISEGVSKITDMSGNNVASSTSTEEPWLIIFTDNVSDSSYTTYHIFVNDTSIGQIKYLGTNSSSIRDEFVNANLLTDVDSSVQDDLDIFATNTTSLKFTPESGEDFEDSYTVQIEATVESGDTSYTGTTQVTFRNK